MIVNKKMAEGVLSLLELTTLEGLTKDVVNNAYRVVAKKAHPDAGGSAELFVAVDRAKGLLLEYIKRCDAAPVPDVGLKPTACPTCGGSGRLRVHRGFHAMNMMCGTCHGTGEAEYRPDQSND